MKIENKDHFSTMSLVSPARGIPLLKDNDFSTTFVPTGPLPIRELELKYKGGNPNETLAIMEKAEAWMTRRAATFEDPPLSVKDSNYGDDEERKDKQAAIEGSVDATELKTHEGKAPSPIDFIKLVQSDPYFAKRFCYCYRNGDFYDYEIVAYERID